MKIFKNIVVLFSFFYVFSVLAFDPEPLAVIKNTSNSVLNSLKQNKNRLKDKKVVFNIVNEFVSPHFDLYGISRAVVGKNYWESSSSFEQAEFIKEFKRYVINMYSSALSSYSNETITFQQMRNYDPNQTKASIYSTVIRNSAPSVSLNYRMIKIGNTWKIYDFTAEGISMVQSYRAQFENTLSSGGLPKLTNQLRSRN